MTAEEARQLSLSNADTELKIIYNAIRAVASKGNRQYNYHYPISDELALKLGAQGYDITHLKHSTMIKW